MKSHIVRKDVVSSNIMSHGYDPATNTMAIEFRSGDVWHYHDVPQEKSGALDKADSIGSYFHKEIKSKHKGTQIE